ncbi:hypothetical protein J4405_02225 [Candidatus Woesearchaeota archaeon]|nr:hypothetical protein [Candidatus Woesearchaeota archaeon]
MVKRYIKRKGKTYGPYHYKSKRIGKQVKSIYVGKEENGKIKKRKHSKVQKVHEAKEYHFKDKRVHEFKLLLRKADSLLIENRVAEAMQVYTELTNLYKKIKDEKEKLELYERARMIYDRIRLQSG